MPKEQLPTQGPDEPQPDESRGRERSLRKIREDLIGGSGPAVYNLYNDALYTAKYTEGLESIASQMEQCHILMEKEMLLDAFINMTNLDYPILVMGASDQRKQPNAPNSPVIHPSI